ncbi:Ig-like domain-containing protein [uncultured Sanguibacteroides sp.]|uniref:Ig-like domain-containing protein n=1 Tax=uncultured Sanguibacteroides sp. TaxID=1635151 RepID=UPI0025D8FE78|nr:Ig-like domain-containing protein [uncultured Sanguibacteroides sp.]
MPEIRIPDLPVSSSPVTGEEKVLAVINGKTYIVPMSVWKTYVENNVNDRIPALEQYVTNETEKLKGTIKNLVAAEVQDAITNPLVISTKEKRIGRLGYSNEAGIIDSQIFQRTAKISSLPKNTGATKEFILSTEPLGNNMYLNISAFVVSTNTKIDSEFFYNLYDVVKVFVAPDFSTRIVIKCKETTTLDLNATVLIEYVKYFGERVSVDIELAGGVDPNAVQVEFPKLKYNKSMLVSLITDDANASSYCATFAAINDLPVCTEDFYHAAQAAANDFPQSALPRTGKTLGYTDGAGNERRFAHAIAIWPNVGKNGVPNMDTKIVVDQGNTTNKYRFMQPAMVWDDIKPMLKFGCSVGQHNINADKWDINSISNIMSGYEEDETTCINRLANRGMKIMYRPDGNDNYVEAAKRFDPFLLVLSEGGNADNQFFPATFAGSLYKKNIHRLFPADIPTLKTYVTGIRNAALEARKWCTVGAHRTNTDWVEWLKWMNDMYGKDGDDSVWFCTPDEFYEYYYIRTNSVIRKSVTGSTLHLDMYIPSGQYFYYPDFSLLLSGITNVSNIVNIVVNDVVKGVSHAINAGKLLLNLNCNSNLLQYAEEFTAKFEGSQDNWDKTNALYFVNQLKPELKESFLNRINKQPDPVALTSAMINAGNPTTMNQNVTMTLALTGTPSHYRIGEMADLSTANWITYTGNISYSLSSGFGIKTVYVQVKNSIGESSIVSDTIEYIETPAGEVPVTALNITGNANVKTGEDLQLSVAYTPTDTTQREIVWSSSNIAFATIDNTGLVRGVAEGNVTITARSLANSAVVATKSVQVKPAGSVIGSVEILIAMRNTLVGGGTCEADSVTGKTINAGNVNGVTVGGQTELYDSGGNLLTDFSIMTKEERAAATGEAYQNFTQNFGPDLTGVTGLPYDIEYFKFYQHAYKYNGTTYPVYGLKVPNGTYRIKILSSTSRDESSANGHVAINGVEQTLPTPAFSLTNNSVNWFEFTNIAVTDGKLLIKIWSEKSKYFGINFIELLKL